MFSVEEVDCRWILNRVGFCCEQYRSFGFRFRFFGSCIILCVGELVLAILAFDFTTKQLNMQGLLVVRYASIMFFLQIPFPCINTENSHCTAEWCWVTEARVTWSLMSERGESDLVSGVVRVTWPLTLSVRLGVYTKVRQVFRPQTPPPAHQPVITRIPLSVSK